MLRLAYLACLYLWYEFCSWTDIKHRKSRGQTCVGESSGERTRVDEEDDGASTRAPLASALPADLVQRKRQGQYRTHGTAGGRHVGAKRRNSASTPEACPSPAGQDSMQRGSRWTDADGHSEDLRRTLKRSAIWEKVTPLTVLTSIVSDLDLFADWYFLKEGLEDAQELVADVAFVLTIVGTVMYVLLTLEFHPVSEAWTWCRGGRALSPLQHVPLGWQLLLNAVVEDIPQLVITWVTSPTSVAGVLNIATAGFALLAKMAEGFATRKDLPMSSQLRMIDTDPGVVQHLLNARHKAEELAANAATLAVLVNRFGMENAAVARNPENERHSKRLIATAYQVMQVDPGFLNGELGYIREKLEVSRLDLGHSGLKGKERSLPPSLGDVLQLAELNLGGNSFGGVIPGSFGNLTALTTLNLGGNRLVEGHIPPELGGLRELQELNLQDNDLTGTIPAALGNLSKLERLYLDRNKLGGTLPRELGTLRDLRVLYLGGNLITGETPRELAALANLQQLNLATGQLRGAEDEERLGQLFPNCEISVSSWTNEWG
ncbi:unnamed protein product [Ectocarpus fasciculatus]